MDEKDKLDGKKKLENIAWASFIASYFGQNATCLLVHTPIGLEQYSNNLVGDGAGFLLRLGGLGYGLYSIATSRGCYDEKELVTDGPHRVVRHPIYLGFRLSSIGMMISNPSLENLIAGAAVLVTTEITARMEDKKLLELYGGEFEEYRNRVSGWIPYANSIKDEFKTLGKVLLKKSPEKIA